MALPVGAQAPDFTLPDANKTPISLSSFRGKQAVLLVFYPFAFSGTCTAELCQLRDDLERLPERTGAGAGDLHRHLPVAQGLGGRRRATRFPLLSDFWPHGAVAQAYDVFFEKAGMALRGTFLVDVDGVIVFSEANGPGEPRDQTRLEARRGGAAGRGGVVAR